MSNMYNFYYRQKVLEGELDNAFSALEMSIMRLLSDSGFTRDDNNPAEYGGIVWGLTGSHTSALDIRFVSGASYDEDGNRIAIPVSSTADVTVSNIGDTATEGEGGTPTGAALSGMGVGNECWVTVYIKFARKNTDQRFDGYNQEIWFSRAESFLFHVAQGAPQTIGSLNDTHKPARILNNILLIDVHLRNTSGTIEVVTTDSTRREILFNVTASAPPNKAISAATVRDALKALLNMANDHFAGISDVHPASAISLTPPLGVWADGVSGDYGASTLVSDALANLMVDIAKTTEPAGAKRIGAKAQSGTLTANGIAVANLVAGTLESQLTTLLSAVNNKIARGGDSGLTGNFLPTTDGGSKLGDSTHRFDAELRDVKIETVGAPLSPDLTTTHDLGTALAKWNIGYINSIISAIGNITTLTAGTLTMTDTATMKDTLVKPNAASKNGLLLDASNYSLDQCGQYNVQEVKAQRDTATTVYTSRFVDALGLEDKGYGFVDTNFIPPLTYMGASISDATFRTLFSPLDLSTLNAPDVEGQEGTSPFSLVGTAIDVNPANAAAAIFHGSGSYPLFSRDAKPSLGIAFSLKTTGRDASKLKIYINLKAYDDSEYIRIVMSPSFSTDFDYQDSSGTGTHQLFTTAAEGILYSFRLAVLSSSSCFASCSLNTIFTSSHTFTGLSFSDKKYYAYIRIYNDTGSSGSAYPILNKLVINSVYLPLQVTS